MRNTRPGRLPWWVLAPALLLAALLAILRPGERTAAGAALEGRLLDLRYQMRGPVPAPASVAIIVVDDRTIERLGSFPVQRDTIARLVSALGALDPRVIAIDMLLIDPGSDAAADAALAQALTAAPRVVLAASVRPAGAATDDALSELAKRNGFSVVVSDEARIAAEPAGLDLPLSPFATRATLGHVNVTTDRDGSLNRIPLSVRVERGTYLPALALEAVRLFLQLPRDAVILKVGKSVSLGARRLSTDAMGRATVNYYGGRTAIETISAIDILEGRVERQRLAGRLVFLGSTATGFGDLFNTPFDRGLPGVAVHAALAGNLIDGSLPLRDRETWIFDLILALAVAGLTVVAANLRSPVAAFAALGAVFLADVAVLQAAFAEGGMWLDAVTQLSVIALIGTTILGARFVLQRRQNLVVTLQRDNLARYQSPLLADWLAADKLPPFTGRVQDVAVAFVDVVAFTGRSERLGPQRTAQFLRALHERFERAALGHGGVIIQFMGDGAMIVFGLPDARPDDAARALLACQELAGPQPDAEDAAGDAGAGDVRLRVSLHYGPATTAILGGEQQGQLTVSGDTVNVASRLQDLAKEAETSLVVSVRAMQAAGGFVPERLRQGFLPLPDRYLRGRSAPIDVWIWHGEDAVTV